MYEKEKYVLIAIADRFVSDGYYTGKNYIYQGEKYAVVDRDISKAKVYSSKKRAEKVCKMGFSNYLFEAEKLKE